MQQTDNNVDSKKIKCVVIGDGAIGKTCMVTVFGSNKFPGVYTPTVAAQYESTVEFEGQEYVLNIWDTSG